MRTLTTAAQCAKEIRTKLKRNYPGIVFRVRSETYSMGDSVNVDWVDGPAAEKVESLLCMYKYGHFDSMADMYENTNRRDDIPQTKYLFCDRQASRERKQAAVDWLNAHTSAAAHLDDYGRVVGGYSPEWREYPDAIVHRMLSGYYKRTSPQMDFSEWVGAA